MLKKGSFGYWNDCFNFILSVTRLILFKIYGFSAAFRLPMYTAPYFLSEGRTKWIDSLICFFSIVINKFIEIQNNLLWYYSAKYRILDKKTWTNKIMFWNSFITVSQQHSQPDLVVSSKSYNLILIFWVSDELFVCPSFLINTNFAVYSNARSIF